MLKKDLLIKIRDEIKKRGWTKGRTHGTGGTVCLVGAYQNVVGHCDTNDWYEFDTTLWPVIRKLYPERIWHGTHITKFNDAEGIDVVDVYSVLEAAIAAAN